MAHRSDQQLIQTTRNTARFFVENRSIAWVVLVAVSAWGVYGYVNMPKRKDPDIPVRIAVATCTWPGATAEQVEQLVTRPMEQKIAENSSIQASDTGGEYGIKSVTLPGVAMVHVQLDDDVADPELEFSDINLKLDGLNISLPQGAGPIQFNSGFGKTAALMLTVASPKERPVQIALRARDIARAIEQTRARLPPDEREHRAAVVVAFPLSVNPAILRRTRDIVMSAARVQGFAREVRPIQGPGFVGFDASVDHDDAQILAITDAFLSKKLGVPRFHPDAWQPVVIRDPHDAERRLAANAGDAYTYRELDELTDLIARSLQGIAQVSKVDRSGVLPQQIVLEYSQEQLASYSLQPSRIKQVLGARNITLPGGTVPGDDINLLVYPSGAFTDVGEIGDVMIATTDGGVPVYLRDLVEINEGYQSPPQFLNFYRWRDANGRWQRSRAITLSVQMRPRQQIAAFGAGVDAALAESRPRLPDDLIVARTSDQPRQVAESVGLFMEALYEAVILVVVVTWLGFWEWRAAVLIALSIPLTLALTFGLIDVLGVELQQVSIAALIIALGLLVDDPVVAGDAIKRGLGDGHRASDAAWLGPTKLARAIVFATVTNIVAYLPFLLLTGTTGDFVHSLPVVMTCTLVASRLVSMTFVPLLGYYLLRAGPGDERTIVERRARGITGLYYRVGTAALRHRWGTVVVSFGFLFIGGLAAHRLQTSFFPEDVQYWSYVDVWLPNNATLDATNAIAIQAESVIARVANEYAGQQARRQDAPPTLTSITTFIGGGGPRFWFTIVPELRQLNYAQLIIQVADKDDTPELVARWQQALSAEVSGAVFEVRQLQTTPIAYPIEVFLSDRADVSPDPRVEAESIATLRRLAEEVERVFRAVPQAASTRDDWGQDALAVKLHIDPDRANLAGLTNFDVATSSAAGLSGYQVTSFLRGDEQIPVVVRLRMEERAQLSELRDLYVYASEDQSKIPLLDVAEIQLAMEPQRIRRRDHFRTISVICFPFHGVLASTVLSQALPVLRELSESVPPGIRVSIGGERAKQAQGFHNLMLVLAVSVSAIFLALVIQFNSAIKPVLVFAAVPYGVAGAVVGLAVMGASFSFMAFLGIVSLVGVIVSHVIVLFDFIEENRERGEPLEDSLLNAGVVRLRPVMITSGATMLALIPLAIHGGPLWQPLCYAQIGGLAVATFIELLLVPALYAIFVYDLKLVSWVGPGGPDRTEASVVASVER